MKFFDLDGNEINKESFISYYCDKYYERNCGHVAEELIDKILYKQGEYSIIDIYYILAWKIDGIDKKKTNDSVSNPEGKVYFYENRGWVESKLSGNNNGKPIELEKVLKLSSDLSEIKKEWMKKNFADDEKGASDLLANLASSGANEMGSVFYLTLLYFLTGSRWPIYDSMAYKSMIAIKEGYIPNKDQIDYKQQLPEKGANYPERLSRIVEDSNNQYMEYVEFLKDFEAELPKGRRYMESRDIDRALWEYGHYFTQKKTRKYPDSYNPDLYKGDEIVRYYLGNCGKKTLFCLSINPSHACDKYSDPTMNTLINIMGKKGYDSCVMINPAPYRSPKPSGLPKEADPELLKRNLEEIDKLFQNKKGSDMLCGWGDYVLNSFPWFKESLLEILKKAKQNHIRLFSVNVNKSGQPTHLSYMNRKNKTFDFDHGNGTYKLTEYEPDLKLFQI